ncbi:major histocompatibility complex class I-related gene protein-like [Eleutherodactylus coqui]|uniref:major histocompatibility complex class I-related gene protein-like n=1 Tax=Eleutherodactylus coqui TaxID=57060 RepID=UPI0034631651
MQNILYAVMNYLNDTEGYHILQNIDGCALLPNGTVHLVRKYHYNGKPLMVFDWETKTWIAGLSEHENMVEDLFRNITIAEDVKNMSLNECIPHIKELLELGRFTFDKKEAPVVRVTQIPIDNDEVRVNCLAYGHYPKNIFMMWYKNGQQMSEEMMERVILPIPGLTYLTSLSFSVTSVDDEVYTCRVNHSIMQRDFIQHWRISGDYENLSGLSYIPFIGGVIAICLAVILIVALIMFGIVSFARNKKQ